MLDQTGVHVAGDEPSRILLAPSRVTTRSQVLSRPSHVPAEPGVYAWYLDVPPPGVPVEGTHRTEFATSFT